jgi:acetate kinase
MRVLKASTAPAAEAAIDHLVYRIVKFVGAYTAVLFGLDAFVFTAGMGENDAQLRAKVLAKLAWMGQSSTAMRMTTMAHVSPPRTARSRSG